MSAGLIVEWAAQERGGATPLRSLYDLACHAAFHGQTECLGVLSRYALDLDGGISAGAARGRHVSCLQLAHELGVPWTVCHAHMAVTNGRAHTSYSVGVSAVYCLR